MKVYLELARVSNLPTVWTNCLAAVVVARGGSGLGALGRTGDSSLEFNTALVDLIAAMIAMSLLYTGGMFLNDALDSRFDAVHAPARPIPSGRISRRAVLGLAVFQLFLGWGTILGLSAHRFDSVLTGASCAVSGLVVAIVVYNAYHKENPLSPLIMGLCRVGVYCSVGLLGLSSAHGSLPESATLLPAIPPEGAMVRLSVASSLLLGYLVLLTFFAKREWRGGAPPVPIHVLIAGISLVDGVVLAAFGAPVWSLFGLVGFWLTLRLQRFVRGT